MQKPSLKTLGKYTLEPFGIKRRIPILILTYLSLEGPTDRSKLSELIWPNKSSAQQTANLSEAIYRINELEPKLITGNTHLKSSIQIDYKEFLANNSYEALKHYEGNFLAAIEFGKRFTFGEELLEWVFNKREEAANHALNLNLEKAEGLARQKDFKAAAELIEDIYPNDSIAYFSTSIYERLHLIFLAAEHPKAASLKEDAEELFDLNSLQFLNNPAQARAQLANDFIPKKQLFIGRETDLQESLKLLTSHQLLSIIGEAGIGKTTFLQQLCQAAHGESYSQRGIHLIYLENLEANATEEELLEKIITKINPNYKKEKLELLDLTKLISDKALILALDNVEQLIPRIRIIVNAILSECPNARIILSSRQITKLQQEKSFRLKHLSFPTNSKEANPENYSAIHLFQELAKQKGLTLKPQDTPHIIKLCQQLDGLPLAIHLCAAWLETMHPQDISQEIQTNLNLLSEGYADNQRQQNINAAFQYSLDLLFNEEQQQLITLAVFSNDFSSEASNKITNISHTLRRDFVEKSLLRCHSSNKRFSFHPLLKRILKSKLNTLNTKKELQDKHANYYLDKLNILFSENNSPNDLKILLPEKEEIASAWKHACDNAWHDRLINSAKALQRYANLAQWYSYGDTLLSYALEKTAEPNIDVQAVLYSNLSLFKWLKSDFDNAVSLANKALDLVEQSDLVEERRVSVSRLALGILKGCYSALGEHEKCVEKAQQILALITKTQPSSSAHANALIELEIAEHDAYGIRNFERIHEAEKLAKSNDVFRLPQVLFTKSDALIRQNLILEAQLVLDQAILKSNELGYRRWQLQCELLQIEIFILTDRHESAKEFALNLLTHLRNESRYSILITLLQLLAKIELGLKNANKAEAYLAEALKFVPKQQNLVEYLRIRLIQYQLYKTTSTVNVNTSILQELLDHREKMDFSDRCILDNLQKNPSNPFKI